MHRDPQKALTKEWKKGKGSEAKKFQKGLVCTQNLSQFQKVERKQTSASC